MDGEESNRVKRLQIIWMYMCPEIRASMGNPAVKYQQEKYSVAQMIK